MTSLVLKMNFIAKLLGINRAIGYGVLTRAWGLISGPLTMLIIVSRFSKEQQGYYYTFGSLLAMQIFFELGLTTVLSTFVSHEFAKLSWGEKGHISGDSIALKRFSDLLAKTMKWFGIASIILLCCLIPAGLIFFNQDHSVSIDFTWRMPWVLAVAGMAINFFTTPFLAVIMGSGDVVTVNHREMIGGVIGSCVCWIVIVLHGGLYAVFAVNCGNIIVSWSYLLKYKPELVKLAWRGVFTVQKSENKNSMISWWADVWPMQWKIALSWISGYFIFQLFNPVLFHYHGAIVAGQMGMTLSASNALLGMSLNWMYVKSPEFGKLIATRQWLILDRTFNQVFYQSLAVVVAGAIAGSAAIWYVQGHYQFGNRFIPAKYAALLFGTVCILIIVNNFAIYLRAHKKEPFLQLSILLAIFQGTSTWMLGKYFGIIGVTFGFLAINLFIALPVAYYIWKRCKINWHSPFEQQY